MREALRAEALKVRRSRLPLISVVAFTIAAGVCGMFMFILLDPGRARSLGLIGDKAQFSGATADWPGYWGLLSQAVAIGGLLVYGLIAIWLFGREFGDRTAKDLLALPTSRTAIVLAKFAILAVWTLLLALQVFVLGLAIGSALDLPGGGGRIALDGLVRLLTTAALTALLTTPFALAAGIARGYLPAIGVMFAALFVAQIIATLGFGDLFPYSVPGLYAGVSGTAHPAPGTLGHLLVIATGVAGVVATATWWNRADHSR